MGVAPPSSMRSGPATSGASSCWRAATACARAQLLHRLRQDGPLRLRHLTLACGKAASTTWTWAASAASRACWTSASATAPTARSRSNFALADAFGCGVNDLPLSMVLSWYEQKAVCILLTLLHLGIKGIYLGPTLPAFVSLACCRCWWTTTASAPYPPPRQTLPRSWASRPIVSLRRDSSVVGTATCVVVSSFQRGRPRRLRGLRLSLSYTSWTRISPPRPKRPARPGAARKASRWRFPVRDGGCLPGSRPRVTTHAQCTDFPTSSPYDDSRPGGWCHGGVFQSVGRSEVLPSTPTLPGRGPRARQFPISRSERRAPPVATPPAPRGLAKL